MAQPGAIDTGCIRFTGRNACGGDAPFCVQDMTAMRPPIQKFPSDFDCRVGVNFVVSRCAITNDNSPTVMATQERNFVCQHRPIRWPRQGEAASTCRESSPMSPLWTRHWDSAALLLTSVLALLATSPGPSLSPMCSQNGLHDVCSYGCHGEA